VKIEVGDDNNKDILVEDNIVDISLMKSIWYHQK
jgi:hypothetical protein